MIDRAFTVLPRCPAVELISDLESAACLISRIGLASYLSVLKGASNGL
jgi:hypothetical protein